MKACMPQETKDQYQARKIKEDILLQPARAEAIKLVMQAAQPDGVTVGDEGGDYFVDPQGVVSWGPAMWQGKEAEKSTCRIEEMPTINLLFWVHSAATALAKREPGLDAASDPTGLGL